MNNQYALSNNVVTNQVNVNEEYTISIVRLRPFTITDSKVTLDKTPNSYGILSFARGHNGSMDIIAYVQDERNRNNDISKFKVDINPKDKVIRFVEMSGEQDMTSTPYQMGPYNNPNMGQPFNVLNFEDLVKLMMSLGHPQQRTTVRY